MTRCMYDGTDGEDADRLELRQLASAVTVQLTQVVLTSSDLVSFAILIMQKSP
jgi:hypothetical protein